MHIQTVHTQTLEKNKIMINPARFACVLEGLIIGNVKLFIFLTKRMLMRTLMTETILEQNENLP